MKLNNPLKYWFTMLLILLIASIFAISCKSKKSTSDDTTKDSIFNSVATNTKTEISKAIEDSIAKFIPITKTGVKDCDSICDEKITDLLQQLSFSKTSGNNSYKFLFDKHKRLLSFVVKQEQTINELKTKQQVKARFFTKTKTITITKTQTYIPFWVKVLAWIGGIASLFLAWRFGRIFI